jgi:GGDEF domain-containing protein
VWLLVIALCAVGFLLHYLTGPDLDYGSVFLVPCIAAVWYLGRNAGFATVAISAGAWFAASIVQTAAPHASVVLANTVSRLVVFLLLVWVLDAVHGLLLRLSKSSMTDALTGLENRAAFRDRGQSGMDAANRAALPVSLMFIDLDGFKSVNDSRGHEAGDDVLCEVAATLREGIRRSDLAARLGGDEFAVLLVGSDGAAAAAVSAPSLPPRCVFAFTLFAPSGPLCTARSEEGC